MIGSDTFSTVFGGAPAHTAEHLVEHVRAIVRAGWSPVLLKPGTKDPACILSAAQAKAADRAKQQQLLAMNPRARVDGRRHPCGMAHVIDDPAKVKAIVERFVGQHGGANIGLHLGRSRLLAVDVDTPAEREAFANGAWPNNSESGIERAPGITVESPGSIRDGEWVHYGGGHWVFQLDETDELPAGKVMKGPGGWAAMWGNSYILTPPSSRPEGSYRLVGGTSRRPDWLWDQVSEHGAQRAQVTRDRTAGAAGGPIDQWSADTSWESLLAPAGWIETSMVEGSCGCPVWTAPGFHSSPKSATAHDLGCSRFDISEGWGPLKIWTDHPPDGLPPEGAVTKLQYVAMTQHDGDVGAATSALAIPRAPSEPLFAVPESWATPIVPAEWVEPDPWGTIGSRVDPGAAPAGDRPDRGRVLNAMHDSNDLQDLPDAEPLLAGLLDRGTIAVLVGKFGTYKTFLALAWAAAVATGQAWGDHTVPESVPVLYIAAEGARGIRKRLRAWTRSNGAIPRGQLTVITVAARLNKVEEVEAIGQALEETGAKFMVLDTLHKVAPGMEENDSKDMGEMLGTVNIIRERYDVTILILHHTGHSGARARGSSSFEDDVDSSFVVKLGGDGEERGLEVDRTLHHRKAKDEELVDPILLSLTAVEGTGSAVLAPSAPTDNGNARGEAIDVSRLLDDAGEPAGLSVRATKEALRRHNIQIKNFHRVAEAVASMRKVVDLGQKPVSTVTLSQPPIQGGL